MDKITSILGWMKKNIFWIGCFLLSVGMISTWCFAVFSGNGIDQQRTDAEGVINREIRTIDAINAIKAEPSSETKAHPNKKTEEGMKKEIDKTVDAIIEGWKKRYADQTKILKVPRDILGDEVSDFFEQVDTPEMLDPKEIGNGFGRFRRSFFEDVPKQMVKICQELRTNWEHDPEEKAKKAKSPMGGMDDMMGGGGGMMGGMGGMMGGGGRSGGMGMDDNSAAIDALNEVAVLWDSDNQQLWQRKLTEFKGYDDHELVDNYPTPLQAYMLLQDLWLLEAMFDNIRAINGESDANDLSVIKRIDHVVFGREARTTLGSTGPIDRRLAGEKTDEAAAGDAMGGGLGMDGGMGMDRGGGGFGLGQRDGGTATEGFDKDAQRIPYHGRYVDLSFEPINAETVHSVISGDIMPQANLELIVAKRVPFRIALRMDERKINEFVAQCANSAFVFEVKQFRINRHTANEGIQFNGGVSKNAGGGVTGGGMGDMMGGMGDRMGGGGGMDGMGMDGMGGMGMDGMSGMGGPGDAATSLDALSSSRVESRTSFDVDIEFYGIVKIYNPVREDYLRKAAGQSIQAGDAGAPAEDDTAKLDSKGRLDRAESGKS